MTQVPSQKAQPHLLDGCASLERRTFSSPFDVRAAEKVDAEHGMATHERPAAETVAIWPRWWAHLVGALRAYLFVCNAGPGVPSDQLGTTTKKMVVLS